MLTSPATPPILKWKELLDALCDLLPDYEYGERFLSIVEICDRYDVSNITARRVLTEMQTRGLVEKIQSRGTIVRRPSQVTQVRLVMPAGIRSDYLSHSVIIRRLIQGIIGSVGKHRIDFDTVSEAHIESIFSQRNDAFGFLLQAGISSATRQWLAKNKWPFVLLNPLRDFKGLPHACTDRHQAGYLGAKHLIELGHERIAYSLGSITQVHFRSRLEGYRKALKEAGLPFRSSLIHQSDHIDMACIEQSIDKFLGMRKAPTAIMSCDDDRAIAILNRLHHHGVRVPEDISLLGYPNYPESGLTTPPLSVVDARYEDVGASAMQLLLEQMLTGADPNRQSIVIQPQLITRSSSAVVSTGRGSGHPSQ